MDTPIILVDDRERELIEVLNFLKLDTPIKVTKLEVGDLVCGDAVIERKQATDFVGSIMDGRLSNQIQKKLDLLEF